jgi:hypothetical protein
MTLEEAYSDFSGKVRDNSYYKIKPEEEQRFLQEGEATHQQMLDVLQQVLGRPISSYMVFKAGWDYAQQKIRQVGE